MMFCFFKHILIFIALTNIWLFVNAQTNEIVRQKAFSLLAVSYAYQLPSADLSKRFGPNSNFGLNFSYQTKKNYIYSFESSLIYGNHVREKDIFSNISTSNGFIIDKNGEPADVRLFELGYSAYIMAGKAFPIKSSCARSEISLNGGAGFLQHQILIQVPFNQVPQLAGDYKKGYDRLSNGFSLVENIRYTYLGKSRMLNFYAGIEISESWTKNRRTINYNTQTKDTKQYFDVLTSLRIGLIIPLSQVFPE